MEYYVLFISGNHGWCGWVLGRGVQHGVHLPYDGGGQEGVQSGREGEEGGLDLTLLYHKMFH